MPRKSFIEEIRNLRVGVVAADGRQALAALHRVQLQICLDQQEVIVLFTAGGGDLVAAGFVGINFVKVVENEILKGRNRRAGLLAVVLAKVRDNLRPFGNQPGIVDRTRQRRVILERNQRLGFLLEGFNPVALSGKIVRQFRAVRLVKGEERKLALAGWNRRRDRSASRR